jgi:dephospho-CoA kinase
MLINLIGLPGTGKTTVLNHLEEEARIPLIIYREPTDDIDELVELGLDVNKIISARNSVIDREILHLNLKLIWSNLIIHESGSLYSNIVFGGDRYYHNRYDLTIILTMPEEVRRNRIEVRNRLNKENEITDCNSSDLVEFIKQKRSNVILIDSHTNTVPQICKKIMEIANFEMPDIEI